MNNHRKRIVIREPLSLHEGITLLEYLSPHPEVQYYELEITSVTPESLRRLCSLPYETSLTTDNHRLLLATGLTDFVGLVGEPHVERMKTSRITHYVHPNGTYPVTTPSFSDAHVFNDATQKYQSLSHPKGVIVYQKPVIPLVNPRTGLSWDGIDVRNLTAIYGIIKDFIFFPIPGRTNFHDLSELEQIALQREFAEKTGMIVDETLWENKKKTSDLLTSMFGSFLPEEQR